MAALVPPVVVTSTLAVPAVPAGAVAVMLVELPSDREVNDNVVAFWRPRDKFVAKGEYFLSYRLHWCWEPAEDPALAEKWDEVAGTEGGRPADPAVERVLVPDFGGMSLGQAIHAAHSSGIELACDDPEGRATGVALRQHPAPGPAARGVVCRVAFGRPE